MDCIAIQSLMTLLVYFGYKLEVIDKMRKFIL